MKIIRTKPSMFGYDLLNQFPVTMLRKHANNIGVKVEKHKRDTIINILDSGKGYVQIELVGVDTDKEKVKR